MNKSQLFPRVTHVLIAGDKTMRNDFNGLGIGSNQVGALPATNRLLGRDSFQ